MRSIVIMMALLLGQVAPLPSQELETALAQWSRLGPNASRTDVEPLQEIVLQTAKTGDRAVLERLVNIAAGPEGSIPGRISAFETACRLSDSSQVDDLLDLVEGCQQRLREASGTSTDGQDASALQACSAIVRKFNECSMDDLLRVSVDDTRIVAFLARFPMEVYAELPNKMARRLIRAKVPAQRKTEIAMGIVVRQPCNFVPPALLQLLDSSCEKELRETFRKQRAAGVLPLGIIDALSYLGDQDFVSDLMAVKEAERGRFQYIEEDIDRYIKRIQLQSDPPKLLDYIASPSFLGINDEWAIRRAVALVSSQEEIKGAMLRSAEIARAAGRSDTRWFLADIGKELGLFSQEEADGVWKKE